MIIAISLELAGLAGLGLLPFALLFSRDERRAFCGPEGMARAIPLLLMLGLLADHTIGLLSGDLAAGAWARRLGAAGLAVALALLVRHGVARARDGGGAQGRGAVLPLAATLVLLALLAVPICVLPLSAWDARSIWFFHAKAIYLDGGIHPSAFWDNAEYNFSHKDYPTLVPLLAAGIARHFGFWNEYLPKAALIPVAAAGFLGLGSVMRSRGAAVLAPVASLALLGDLAWNGYMDGWIALYGCVALLGLARWFDTAERWSLVLAVCAVGLALCLKNEGRLLVLCCVPLVALGLLRHRRLLRWRDPLLGLVFVPALLWARLVTTLPANGDLDSAGLLRRAGLVLQDPAELRFRLMHILDGILINTDLLRFAVLLGLFLLLIRPRLGVLLAAAMTVAYLLGLVAVYLGTPHDFRWHIATSLTRVLVLPTLFFLVALIDVVLRLPAALRRPA